MSKLIILLYGDIDLNFMDGSAVWLTSIASVLSSNLRVEVDLLLKAKEQNDHLTSALKGLPNVRLIQPFQDLIHQVFPKQMRLSPKEAVAVMQELHQKKNYDLILVRGFQLVREVMKHESFQKVTVPYLTDFNHDSRSTAEERADLKRIYTHFDALFLQTQEAKEAVEKLIQVNGDKIQLMYPMIPNFEEFPRFRNKHSCLIYSGKFHEDWYTEEIISVTKKLAERNSRIHTKIVGDKFQDVLREKANQARIKKEFQETKAIDWVGAVSRVKSQELIAEADIGISWRSVDLDNDESVELSTKLLEYGRLGKPVLVRRTKMHEELLGQDYPLFVDTEASFIEKVEAVLQDEQLYFEAAKKMYDGSRNFTFQATYGRLSNFIWSFKKEKIKIVFAGHDLKFAQLLIDYFNAHPDFEVRIDQFSSHVKHNKNYSQCCVDWADVIFCEWGLGNSVWYSEHKKIDQVLIVRMHFQEKDLEFPRQMNMKNIDQIIVITPYMLEEFHRIFKIPRHKMSYIDNAINAKKLNLAKEKNSPFNIGICGILPARKRLDLALDLLEKLWYRDSRYKLFIKSKRPEEVSWLMAREKERVYYSDIFKRIETAPWRDHVIFDSYGKDVDQWLQKIGYLVSPSDYEGSHVSVSEAMASGAIPVIRNWKGADTIYPKQYIVDNLEAACTAVEEGKWQNEDVSNRKAYARHKFDQNKINQQVEKLIYQMIKMPL